VKAHYKGANIIVALYYNSFFKGIMFELQASIIKKDFHNVVAFYGRPKQKEVKC
jgi:hypothetical protein